MSGAPSTPIITTRPYILPFGAYTYFFGNNPNGPSASSFTLTVNDFTSTVNSSVSNLIIDNMSTTVYYSSFVVASTPDGDSLPANYRTVQFGAKPDPPTNNSGSVINGKIILDFVPPLNDNGATIGWYVATAPETNTRFNIKYFNSTITTSTLPSGDYNFKVQSVSDAGYSDPLFFSTLAITGSGYTYFNLASYNNNPNYYYRIYNHNSQTWSPLIDSNLDTNTYSFSANSNTNSEVFYVIFNDGTNYSIQFANNSGIITTINIPNNSNYSNSYKAFFHWIYNPDSGIYSYGIFDYDTENYATNTFYFPNSYVNDNWDVDNNLILALYNNNDSLNYFYKINPISIPNVLFSSYQYSSRTEFNRLVLLSRDNNDYYNDVYHIQGFNSDSYQLQSSTYSSRSHGIFGKDNQQYYLRLSNDITGKYDFYVFNFSTFTTPAIKTNITNNSDYYYFEDFAGGNKTSESNNFGITEYTTAMNDINDGGGDMFDNGNFIDIYVSSSLGEVTNTDINYGISSYNGSTYGYYVGNGETYPHTNMSYLNDGTIRWVSHGDVGSDGNGSVTNYSTSYNCTNGRQGTIWANINYGTSDPTIGDIWFTVEKDTWSSIITDFVDNRKTSDDNNYNHYVEVSGQNFMFFKILLSRSSGQFIDESDVLNYVSSYVNDMNLDDSNNFNLINLSSFIGWNYNNSGTYTSYIPNFYNYAYDGGANQPIFANGPVHIYIEQISSFSTFTFSGNEKYLTNNAVGLNASASVLRTTDNQNLFFKVINQQSTYNVSTNLSSFYLVDDTLDSMRDYFYSVMYDDDSGNYYTHIVGNDGIIYYSSFPNSNSYELAGNNMMRQTNSGEIDMFFNSTVSTTSLTYYNIRIPYPDMGSSIIFAYRNEDSSENILTLNNLYPSTLYVPLLSNYNTDRCTSDFFWIFQNSPIQATAIHSDGSLSSYVHPTTDNTYDYNTYYDDKSIAMRYISDNDGLGNYFVYNGNTKTFSLQTELSTNSGTNVFTNNFFYND